MVSRNICRQFSRAFLVLLIGFDLGCQEEPSVMVVNYSDHKEITQEYVSDVRVFVKGKAIDSGEATAHTGEKVAVTGTLKNVISPDNPERVVYGMISIRYRLRGATESEWDVSHDDGREWFGPYNKQKINFPVTIKMEPGEYDLRAYTTSFEMEDGVPHAELVARGQITILPAAPEPTKPTKKR